MLKIKDSVDLKELEKYEFIYHKDTTSSYYGCCEMYNNDISIFINNAKVISIRNNSPKTMFEFDVMYDLIKAGLVEKI